MNQATLRTWETKRTDETRMVEEIVKKAGFPQTDAYRYNSASIRLRVIDPRFEGLSHAQRDELIEPILDRLPERTQGDIMSLFTFAPSELTPSPAIGKQMLLNAEFEDPSPSVL